jgi:predicted RNA-binding Zn ribbon-like protein
LIEGVCPVSSVVVSGLVLPVAIGGHPALDFCNTRAGWGSPAPKEYLSSYDHLAVWTREVGMVGARDVATLRRAARADPASAGTVLAGALALREAAYAVLLGSRSRAAFSVVEARARAARASSTLRRSSPGIATLARWRLPMDGVHTPLLAVAAQLDDLLCSPLSGVVAACPGAGCGWLFADLRGRRRWCDMAVCGNRAKARKHAERVAARRSAG